MVGAGLGSTLILVVGVLVVVLRVAMRYAHETADVKPEAPRIPVGWGKFR